MPEGFRKTLVYRRRVILTGACLFTLAFLGTRTGAIPLGNTDPFALYQRIRSRLPAAAPGFRFRNRSDLLGKTPKTFPGQPNAFTYVAVGDVDRDGFEDLALVYQSYYTGPGRSATHWFQLLKNDGGREFRDVTEERGLGALAADPSVKAAVFLDLDNDGWPDLLVTRGWKPARFFRNEHGKFVEDPSAVPDVPLGDGWGIALFDYDRDGYLDAYVYNYQNSAIAGRDQYAFSSVGNSDSGGPHFLLHNEAGRRLVIVPDGGGLANRNMTQAVSVGDFRGTGFPDLFAANDYGFDRFFANEGGKGFRDRSDALGLIRSTNTMSAATSDFTNEGRIDIFGSNANKVGMPSGFNRLWLNRSAGGEPSFTNVAADLDVSQCGWGWSSLFLDADKDGWPDLMVVNGRHGEAANGWWFYLEESYKAFVPAKRRGLTGFNYYGPGKGIAPRESKCFFLSDQGKKFTDVADLVGLEQAGNARSLAWLDMDNDGQEDLVVGNAEETELLYKGERHNANHWIGFALEGTKSNRQAYGARVTISTSDGKRQLREIYPTNGFLAESSNRALFGVPADARVLKAEFRWPSGISQELGAPGLDRYHRVKEPER